MKKIIINPDHYAKAFVDEEVDPNEQVDDLILKHSVDGELSGEKKKIHDILESWIQTAESEHDCFGKVYNIDGCLVGHLESLSNPSDSIVAKYCNGIQITIEHHTYDDSVNKLVTKASQTLDLNDPTLIQNTLKHFKSMLKEETNLDSKVITEESKKDKRYTHTDIDGIVTKITKGLLELMNAASQHTDDPDLKKALNKMYEYSHKLTPFATYKDRTKKEDRDKQLRMARSVSTISEDSKNDVEKAKALTEDMPGDDIKIAPTANPQTIDKATKLATSVKKDIVFETATAGKTTAGELRKLIKEKRDVLIETSNSWADLLTEEEKIISESKKKLISELGGENNPINLDVLNQWLKIECFLDGEVENERGEFFYTNDHNIRRPIQIPIKNIGDWTLDQWLDHISAGIKAQKK